MKLKALLFAVVAFLATGIMTAEVPPPVSTFNETYEIAAPVIAPQFDVTVLDIQYPVYFRTDEYEVTTTASGPQLVWLTRGDTIRPGTTLYRGQFNTARMDSFWVYIESSDTVNLRLLQQAVTRLYGAITGDTASLGWHTIAAGPGLTVIPYHVIRTAWGGKVPAEIRHALVFAATGNGTYSNGHKVRLAYKPFYH